MEETRNKPTIYVKTFAGFSVRYNGKEIGEGMQSGTQVGLLLQQLLHYRKTGVHRSLIKSTLFEDRDIDDVSHAIRNLVYLLKKRLRAFGLPDVQYVRQIKGVFYWTDEIDVVEDATEFEEGYKDAISESDPEKRLELLLNNCYRYTGRFLSGVDSVIWAIQEAERYRRIFHDCVNETADLLRTSNKTKPMYDLSLFAASVDPFSEWEVLSVEVLSTLGKYSEAEKLYDSTVEAYAAEYGNRTNEYVRELIKKMGAYMMYENASIEEIQDKLTTEEMEEAGGYYCSLPVFQEIYRTVERIMKRSGDHVYLMLCTIVDSKGNPMREGPRLTELSKQLKEAIMASVRHTDTATKYGQGQYLVLLMDTSEENCQVVARRINKHFVNGRQKTGAKFSVHSVVQLGQFGQFTGPAS